MASRTPEKRAEAGRRLNAARDPAATAEAARSNILSAHIALAERRKDPQVRAALVESGRQLGKEHGSAALRRFRETPEARELERISGKRLAALARERARTGYFKSPERVAVRAQSGRIGTCQRWNLDRGKPCVCGVHVGTA